MQGFLLIEPISFMMIWSIIYIIVSNLGLWLESSFSIGLYKRHLKIFLESVFFVVYTDSNQVTLIF